MIHTMAKAVAITGDWTASELRRLAADRYRVAEI